MSITAIVVIATLALSIGGWLSRKVIGHRWYVMVTVPRIARRESANLDREYHALLRKGHHQRPKPRRNT